jgi:ERF superfamily
MEKIILEKLDKILELLLKKPSTTNRSDDIGLLIGALSKAQGSYKKLIPNETYPGGKYANLEAILDAVKDALSLNGLSFYQNIQLLDEGSGAALLITILGHESGQWISSTARVFTGKTDRATGNTYENHKRLHALMLLGIAPSTGDPIAFDDNGGEQEEEQLIEKLVRPPITRTVDPNDVITKDQHNEILIALGDYEDLAKSVKDTYKIDTLADLPREVYHDALAKIRRVRRTTEDYERRKK